MKNTLLREYVKSLIFEKIADNPAFQEQPLQSRQPEEINPDIERKKKIRDIKMKRKNRDAEADMQPKKKTFKMPKLSDNPKVKDAQEHIYTMKRRVGDLDVITYLSNFKKSYDNFNNRITKYDTNRHEISKYLVLLKSNAVALIGILESIQSECEELENKLKD